MGQRGRSTASYLAPAHKADCPADAVADEHSWRHLQDRGRDGWWRQVSAEPIELGPGTHLCCMYHGRERSDARAGATRLRRGRMKVHPRIWLSGLELKNAFFTSKRPT
jgi:hypothetical protein